MKNRQRAPGPKKVIPDRRKKAVYSTPRLHVYGSVTTLTQGNTGSLFDGSSNQPRPAAGSDPAIKDNIVRIGTHPLGIGLYLFDYKPEYRDAWGHGRQFGVMADEVEGVMPEAVSMDPNGYRVVSYAMLGISPTLR